MTDSDLLHFITSYGTRKRCKTSDLAAQYRSHYSWQMTQDLERLVKLLKIRIEGPEILIADRTSQA